MGRSTRPGPAQGAEGIGAPAGDGGFTTADNGVGRQGRAPQLGGLRARPLGLPTAALVVPSVAPPTPADRWRGRPIELGAVQPAVGGLGLGAGVGSRLVFGQGLPHPTPTGAATHRQEPVAPFVPLPPTSTPSLADQRGARGGSAPPRQVTGMGPHGVMWNAATGRYDIEPEVPVDLTEHGHAAAHGGSGGASATTPATITPSPMQTHPPERHPGGMGRSLPRLFGLPPLSGAGNVPPRLSPPRQRPSHLWTPPVTFTDSPMGRVGPSHLPLRRRSTSAPPDRGVRGLDGRAAGTRGGFRRPRGGATGKVRFPCSREGCSSTFAQRAGVLGDSLFFALTKSLSSARLVGSHAC